MTFIIFVCVRHVLVRNWTGSIIPIDTNADSQVLQYLNTFWNGI